MGQKGLRFIGDLFNLDNGNILTREEIKVQYRISMTFLCYESLIRSLPSSIRQARSILFQRPNIPYKLQLFLNKPNITKYYYSLLVDALNKKCNVTDSNLKRKWNRDIGYNETGSLLHVKKSYKPGLCSTHESWVKFDSTLTQMSRVRVESAVKIKDMSRVRVESRWPSFESELSQLDTAWVKGVNDFSRRKRQDLAVICNFTEKESTYSYIRPHPPPPRSTTFSQLR